MGLIVNFTNRTVQGFGAPGVLDYPINIVAWNDVTVTFHGSDERHGMDTSGSIDRVTGDVEARTAVTTTMTGTSYLKYALKCRPTQRMF